MGLFLGVDDTLLEDFKDVPALLNNASTVYYANVVYYGQPFYKVYDDYYLTKLNFIHQALFYPKGFLKATSTIPNIRYMPTITLTFVYGKIRLTNLNTWIS
ncbi:hypothetical protein [Mucilaginibacter antarcticus]|uniref:hypothetical protein n=1 Tax=Mucilaginibacter antarcticus TaxID=1855725 RepID=UPI00363AD9DA